MDLRGKKLVVIGGAGLIGSHTVGLLTREDVGQIAVYDNFVRGTHGNLTEALKDPRGTIFEARAVHHGYGLPYVGLRYMSVYGPRQDYRGAYIAVIMKMLDALDRGEAPRVYGDGSQAYDFVAVSDCAASDICAMKASVVDRFYNVGTGKRTSIKELAEMILRLTGANLPVHFQPGGLNCVKNAIG